MARAWNETNRLAHGKKIVRGFAVVTSLGGARRKGGAGIRCMRCWVGGADGQSLISSVSLLHEVSLLII